MSFSSSRRLGFGPGIPIGLFLDAGLVVLIVSMLVTPLLIRLEDGSGPRPAETKSAERDGGYAVSILFASPPGILIGPDLRLVEAADLEREMRALRDAAPGRRLVVRADPRLPYGEIKTILQSIRNAGFRDVSVIADPDELLR
jgi:biopolymer transport protein ExbD